MAKKKTMWEVDREARMQQPHDLNVPGVTWYQQLLDVARKEMESAADFEVKDRVDDLLRSRGVEVVVDPCVPGGTRLDGYTREAHAWVANMLLGNTTIGGAQCYSGETITDASADEIDVWLESHSHCTSDEQCSYCQEARGNCICGAVSEENDFCEIDALTEDEKTAYLLKSETPPETKTPPETTESETSMETASSADDTIAADTCPAETAQIVLADPDNCDEALFHVAGEPCAYCEWGRGSIVAPPAPTAPIETVEAEDAGDDAVYEALSLQRTDDGLVRDADGTIINEDLAYALYGLTPVRRGLQLETAEDLYAYGRRLVTMQRMLIDNAQAILTYFHKLCAAYVFIERYHRPQVRQLVERTIPRYEQTTYKRDGTISHHAGELKARSWVPSPAQAGINAGIKIFTKPIGGWDINSDTQIKALILQDLGVAHINDLLPPAVREKWGAGLTLTYSKKRVRELAAKAGGLPGMRKIPEIEIGRVNFGAANDKAAFNFDKLVGKPIRAVMTKLAATIEGERWEPKAIEESEDDDV
jgi:hypothetical protein